MPERLVPPIFPRQPPALPSRILARESGHECDDNQRMIDAMSDLAKREPRCGPWDEREDGCLVCRKCGDVDPPGGGPLGF